MRRKLPASFYNPLSLVGAGIAGFNAALIVFLAIVHSLAKHPRPYSDIVIYLLLPGVVFVGLCLVALGWVRERRRLRGGDQEERRLPVIDFNDPRHRSLALGLGVAAATLSSIYAFTCYRAYEYVESNSFCNLCHVNSPEFVSHAFSPHGEVGCVECHIGPGAKYFIMTKLRGPIDMYRYFFHKYPIPLETPISNLRPSRDICETCHGAQYQVSKKLLVRKHFLSDRENSEWTVDLLLLMGAGRIEATEANKPPKIHWHSAVAREIRYASTDPRRLEIPWIEVTGFDGKVRVYRSTPSADKDVRGAEARVMDCIDCHNRAGHYFRPPDLSLNFYLEFRLIDPSLPEIKRVGVKVLDAAYGSMKAAHEGIRQTVVDFYQKTYPDVALSKKGEIETAIVHLQNIYARNYDPAMKVSWKNFPDNAGHMYSLGCFRCHDGKHVSDDGKVLSKDCTLCHLLLTHEVEERKQRSVLTLSTRNHPVDIGDDYLTTNCSECHGGN